MKTSDEFYSLSSTVRALPALEGGVFLISEKGAQFSGSALVVAILGVSDGTRDMAAMIADLPECAPAEVIFVINRLVSEGILERHATPTARTAAPDPLCERLGPFRLISDTPAALAVMRDALRCAGLSDMPATTEIDLVLCSDYVGAMTSQSVVLADHWMPVKLTGQRSYFGPFFGPDKSACPICLQRRLRINRPVETVLCARNGAQLGHPDPHRLSLAPTAADTVSGVVHQLSQNPRSRPDLQAVREFVPQGQRLHEYACTCAAAPMDTARPMNLENRSPIARHLGGFRSRDADEIGAMLSPLVSDLTGLISSAGPLHFDENAASDTRHVWAAAYPVTPRAKSPAPDSFHGVAMGKGLTPTQAKASALCEAVERLSAQLPENLDPNWASLMQLGPDAVHPNSVWQFSDAQIRDRAKWNALSKDDRRHVPPPIQPDQEMAWIPVWSLTHARPKWMMRDLCFANAPEPRFGRFDPNGCAAGSTHAEAALQALLELVERDCVAIWWYNRVRRPTLDPMACADLRVRRLAQGFQDQGWDCWVLDLTNDLNIPCVTALARARSDGRWCIGFGCHFDSGLAVERAMTELAQLFRADGRDGPPPWGPMSETDEAFLFPDGEATLQDTPVADAGSFEELINWTVDRLNDRGIETLILNQSRPDTGLAVVKVFAPGLRHFWPRFGPGRLYDVPVELGWRSAPNSEDGLNQTHLFL